MCNKKYTCRLLLTGLLLLGHSVAQATDSFRVIVSIKPIHSILAGLMEGTQGPELLIGEGQTPYDFEPTDAQLKDLADADLLAMGRNMAARRDLAFPADE